MLLAYFPLLYISSTFPLALFLFAGAVAACTGSSALAAMQSTAVRGLLLLFLAANLLLNATFVVLFVLNPVDYCLTSREVRPCNRVEGGGASGPRKPGTQHRKRATLEP